MEMILRSKVTHQEEMPSSHSNSHPENNNQMFNLTAELFKGKQQKHDKHNSVDMRRSFSCLSGSVSLCDPKKFTSSVALNKSTLSVSLLLVSF